MRPDPVKEELSKVIPDRSCCRKAELSALLRAEGVLHLQGGERMALHTESESASVARTIMRLSDMTFGCRPDLSIQRLPRLRNHACYCLSFYEGDNLLQILDELEIVDAHGRPLEGIPHRLLRKRCCRLAYLRGMFLGCGFLGDLRRNRHLELNLSGKNLAEELMSMMDGLGITARLTERRSSWVVYMKSKESILNLLAAMGAYSSVLEAESKLIFSEIRGDVNRVVNCETANLKKTARAAQERIRQIKEMEERGRLRSLPPSLREMADLRLRYPHLSLAELGEKADPPLSKAAVQHRLERITEAYNRTCGENTS